MSILTILFLVLLVIAAIAVIAGGVYYEVYYKPAHSYDSVTGPSPPVAQGSLITPSNATGTPST
jgi:hypothetical protein